jgi:hypothetical protein
MKPGWPTEVGNAQINTQQSGFCTPKGEEEGKERKEKEGERKKERRREERRKMEKEKKK